MNVSDAAKLVTKCAAFDNRQPSREAAMAWAEVMTSAGIELEEASIAISEHFTESTEYLKPAHVVKLVRDGRKRRAQSAGSPDYPPGLTWSGERAWRRLWLNALRAGASADEATVSADEQMQITRPEISPRPVQQLIAGSRLAQGSRAS